MFKRQTRGQTHPLNYSHFRASASNPCPSKVTSDCCAVVILGCQTDPSLWMDMTVVIFPLGFHFGLDLPIFFFFFPLVQHVLACPCPLAREFLQCFSLDGANVLGLIHPADSGGSPENFMAGFSQTFPMDLKEQLCQHETAHLCRTFSREQWDLLSFPVPRDTPRNAFCSS